MTTGLAPPPIALGIVCKAPRPGHAKTRLAARIGPKAAARLAEAFLLDVIAAAEVACASAGLRPFAFIRPADAIPDMQSAFSKVWTLDAQIDGDLGAIMLGALDVMREACPGGAVLIGSDLPLIDANALIDAADRLRQHRERVVVGPTPDGGYYLIGTNTPRAAHLFEPMAWSTRDVLATTLGRAHAKGLPLDLVAACADVDTPEDLDQLRTFLAEAPAHIARATRAALAEMT